MEQELRAITLLLDAAQLPLAWAGYIWKEAAGVTLATLPTGMPKRLKDCFAHTADAKRLVGAGKRPEARKALETARGHAEIYAAARGVDTGSVLAEAGVES